MKKLVLYLLFCVAAFAQQPVTRILVCTDAGANDTYTCSPTTALGSYVTGQRVFFYANTANTGVATLNISTLGAKTIKKVAGGITTDLSDNDIRAGQFCELVYDGTNFQIISQLGNGGSGGGISSLGVSGSPQTGTTQLFAVGTSGSDFAVASSGDTHTWNLPDAGASARGVVSTGSQTFGGAKTFNNQVISSYNSAASSSAAYWNGTWLTGGTGTTNFPHFYIVGSGATAPTGLSTNGTGFGLNAIGAFTGDLVNFMVGGTSLYKIGFGGIITMQSGGISIVTTPASSRTISSFAPYIVGSSIATATAGYNLQIIRTSGSMNHTSGVSGSLQTLGTIAPTSGTGTYNGIAINDTVNQTSTASGIIRGILIDPTLTSAADYRGLDLAAKTGFALTATGDLRHAYFGNIAYTKASGTVTNASTVEIEGAPSISGGAAITNIYALNVKAGVSRLAGNVQLVPVAVGSLPTCNSAAEGTVAAVNDAAATPVYNATVANGGSVKILVYCNGTNWTNH